MISKDKKLLFYIKQRSKENTKLYTAGIYTLLVYVTWQQLLLEIAKSINSLAYYSEAISTIREQADEVGVTL